jgi:CRP-like cAMP-binding protein
VDRFLVEMLAWQVEFLMARGRESLEVPAERRVLRRVAELALVFRDAASPVVIPMPQEDVASLAGVTRPTANRVLQAASQKHLLELGWRRILVPDLDRLTAAAYEDDAAR